jgi:hypothetical protein
VKLLAFGIGLAIAIFGAAGIFFPTGLTWIANHVVTSGAFYVIAAIRIGFGLVLISVAADSRAPKAIRVLGYLIVISGITAAVVGLVGIGQAHQIIDWWIEQGAGVTRLTSVLVLALGGFVAYACAPVPRAG